MSDQNPCWLGYIGITTVYRDYKKMYIIRYKNQLDIRIRSLTNQYNGMSPVAFDHSNVFFPPSTLPKTKSSPLKMDGWKTILSFWDFAYFQGLC